MPEGENLFSRFRKLISRSTEESAPEMPSAEQKAKKAFFDAVAKSLTEEGLQSIADFEPPNGGFDLSKLDDGSVFRVLSTKELKGATRTLTLEDSWDYLCVVVDPSDQQRRLYRPGDVDSSDGKILLLHQIYNTPTLERGPESVRVTETPFEDASIDWEAPLKTLPFAALCGGYMGSEFNNAEVEIHKIEIVDGGKTVSEPERGKLEGRQQSRGFGWNPPLPDVS